MATTNRTARGEPFVRRVMMAIGIGTMTAFVAAMMPVSWMEQTAEFFGIEFQALPVTEYLARHLSLLYGMVGVAFCILARSPTLDRTLLRQIGFATIAFGVAQAVVDGASEMPFLWSALESISTVVGGGFLLWLARWLPRRVNHHPTIADGSREASP